MDEPRIASVSVTIRAPASEVWKALVTPDTIKRYMFGATVVSDWKEGSPIVWKGEWKGAVFEDKGVLLRVEPGRLLRYSHFSPLSGRPDVPESTHTVNIELAEQTGQTRVTLSQDNNATEEAREHSEKNWRAMLDAMRRLLET